MTQQTEKPITAPLAAPVDDPNWDGKLRDANGNVIATPISDEAATFILQSVNASALLVEALKTALSHHAKPDAISDAEHRQMMNAGVTALKAAGVKFSWEGEASHV